MQRIDYYFSVMSPFTYLAGTRLEVLAGIHFYGINYKPMDIARVFAETGGTAPKDRHWSRQEYRLQDLRRVAESNEMPINLKPAFWPADPLPASCSLIAALDAGFSIGATVHAFVRAVWAEERNIAHPDIVDAILAENDIDKNAIAPFLDGAEAQYQQNTGDAIESGVFGAPFYLVGEEKFWGQDRLQYLDS